MANMATALREDLTRVRKMHSSMQSKENLRLCIYLGHNNHHLVVGASTGVRYGYRKRGDMFMMHIEDIVAQPHLFKNNKIIAEPDPSRYRAWIMHDLEDAFVDATNAVKEFNRALPQTCEWCDTEGIILLTPISPGGYYTCPHCGGYK